ncbi:MAG: hypothetical protein K0B02_02415 [DPANN group archaeon]|nr:hypothetical protein [DPANN group archaeon]
MKFSNNQIFAFFVIFGFFAGIFFALEFVPPNVKIVEVPKYIDIVNTQAYTGVKILSGDRRAMILLPAINENDTGVTAYLTVSVVPGSGKVLVAIDNILSHSDTQESARTAAYVASKYTGYNMSALDVMYDIVADASILQGPSAGAALTVATIFALENKTLRDDVMITGTINHDMTVGPAGRVEAKAIASKASGAVKFLVPVGESVKYEEVEFCADYGIFTDYCNVEYVPVRLIDSVGMDIVEVYTMEDVVREFTR